MTDPQKQPQSMQYRVVVTLASIFLALVYICFGYAVCASVPFVTERVALATVDTLGSPFDQEQLADCALAVRDYSFGDHDASALYGTVALINAEAGTSYGDTPAEELRDAPEEYTITSEQVTHLDDVYDISARFIMPIFGIVAMAVFLLMVGLRMFGAGIVATTLKWSGIIALIILAAIAVFAVISFNGFFSAFHSILFEDGSWTFSADSLLIRSLPEGFWASIAAVWAALSALLAGASVLLGVLLRKKVEGR